MVNTQAFGSPFAPSGLCPTMFWQEHHLSLVDQTKLPHELNYVECHTVDDIITAIRDMIVRGAPAIGVTGAYGVAISALTHQNLARQAFERAIWQDCSLIIASRPTAVNLKWAVERMWEYTLTLKMTPREIALELVEEANRIYEEDIEINRHIGYNGHHLLTKGMRVLTHCNAGALATAGYGTALGVIRSAYAEHGDLHIWVDETRPYMQGARLTAWELKEEGIPATLITDSMAGYIMGKGWVDAVIVGADRICANGDTANKIGTYSLAVLARAHKIPFYVAAPLSTIDLRLENGLQIPIEERDADEITHFKKMPVAPKGMPVYNPSFDMTPGELIEGIITEKGLVRGPYKDTLPALFPPQFHL
jgi:methylthioribose-1-phosphate isomerase